jgi:hypothetical protein
MGASAEACATLTSRKIANPAGRPYRNAPRPRAYQTGNAVTDTPKPDKFLKSDGSRIALGAEHVDQVPLQHSNHSLGVHYVARVQFAFMRGQKITEGHPALGGLRRFGGGFLRGLRIAAVSDIRRNAGRDLLGFAERNAAGSRDAKRQAHQGRRAAAEPVANDITLRPRTAAHT